MCRGPHLSSLCQCSEQHCFTRLHDPEWDGPCLSKSKKNKSYIRGTDKVDFAQKLMKCVDRGRCTGVWLTGG